MSNEQQVCQNFKFISINSNLSTIIPSEYTGENLPVFTSGEKLFTLEKGIYLVFITGNFSKSALVTTNNTEESIVSDIGLQGGMFLYKSEKTTTLYLGSNGGGSTVNRFKAQALKLS